MNNCYIGVDLGGTKTIVASADKNGNILKKEASKTPVDLEKGLEMLENMISSVAVGRIESVGCACGGPLDWKKGVVSPVHMPNWRSVHLGDFIKDRFSCDFYVDVDTNIAALGEYYFGKASGYKKFIYLTLSTGMGGAFLIDGRIYRGKDDGHPEIGHQAINHSLKRAITEPFCDCGSIDCLEGLVSGTAIKRLYGIPAEHIEDKNIIEEIAYNLGQGLRNIVALHAPDAIFLGGGVACGFGERLLGPARKIMDDHVKIVPKPLVSLSSLGYESALRGSIAVAIHGLGD